MYERSISPILKKSLENYPVVTLVGPRQSGKTTLCRHCFPDFEYLSLEDPDLRELALRDPRGFLSQHSGSVILDEIQRVPELTSYLQTLIDSPENPSRKFVLTGSHNLLLMEAVSQSLAGRTRVLELLPLSQKEISLHEGAPRPLTELLVTGGYPAIYQREIAPRHWYKDYFSLFIERDIRAITQITSLNTFATFVRLCAGRAGQLLNFSSLATEAGVSQPTAKSWFSALFSSFVCFPLAPHHRNFNKRLIKTQKLYFYDTGLLCYLLGIEAAEQLDTHPLRGAIFENFVVSEMFKVCHNQGEQPRLFFWRDRAGLEVDVVEERGTTLYPTEIKLSGTFSHKHVTNLIKFNALQANTETALPKEDQGRVLCTASSSERYKGYRIDPWQSI